MKERILRSADDTVKFGARLGRLISGGEIIALRGGLGSGKTTLVKGIAKGAGIKDATHVNSPSFVIVKEYAGRIPIYHFDVYRLDGYSAMESVGYKDLFYGEGASVIEWADKITELLPDEYLDIELTVRSENERRLVMEPHGLRYEELMRRLHIL